MDGAAILGALPSPEATFPVRLDRAEADIEAFRAAPMVDPDGVLAPTEIAVGIQRRLFAVIDQHGPDPAAWPDPISAAQSAGDAQEGS